MSDNQNEQQQETPALDYEEIYSVVCEMVDELNFRYNDDHRILVVKALRALGVSDNDIRGFFSGNIIL